MTERPILFSGAMVRALLDGSKSQTRRVCKPQPFDRSYSKHDHHMDYVSGRASDGDEIDGFYAYSTSSGGAWRVKCPYGQPGDRLWVRESWHQRGAWRLPAWPEAESEEAYWSGTNDVNYAADAPCPERGWRARPSIHMPRWASRILLEVVAVRVERLNECSEPDARAEGAPGGHGSIPGYQYSASPREHYRHVWEGINGAGSWDANPWVWVVEFKRVMP